MRFFIYFWNKNACKAFLNLFNSLFSLSERKERKRTSLYPLVRLKCKGDCDSPSVFHCEKTLGTASQVIRHRILNKTRVDISNFKKFSRV